MKTKFLILLFLIMICQTNAIAQKSIIFKMKKKWEGKWAPNMKFEQNVYLYKDEKIVKEQIWQEILNSPRNLHIRFDGFETGNGMLFKNDSVSYFSKGIVTKKEKRIHHLLLLGFDVFFLPISETEEKLRNMGFNLDLSHEKSFENRKVIVVGSKDENDITSSQFWIDKKNLYFVRAILNTNNSISDIEFKNYKTIEKYPVATEISFKTNGKMTMVEKYFNISFPKTVDQSIYDETKIKEAKW